MTIVTFKVPHTVLVLLRTIITIKLNFDMDNISSISGTGIDLFIYYTILKIFVVYLVGK